MVHIELISSGMGLHWDTDADEMYMHAHGLNYMWLYNKISHISIQYTPYKYV